MSLFFSSIVSVEEQFPHTSRHVCSSSKMCVTKCKQKKKMKSAKKNLSTPGTGGSVNPEMKSISHSTTAQSGEKGASKMAKVPSKEVREGWKYY